MLSCAALRSGGALFERDRERLSGQRLGRAYSTDIGIFILFSLTGASAVRVSDICVVAGVPDLSAFPPIVERMVVTEYTIRPSPVSPAVTATTFPNGP